MATLDALKRILRRTAIEKSLLPTRTLSDTQYSDAFDIVRKSGWATYKDFIIPQLSLLLADLSRSRGRFSVLEIGPGPESVIGYLPDYLKRKIRTYAAFEPNGLFARKLEEWLCSTPEPPLPDLEDRPDIHQIPFSSDSDIGSGISKGTNANEQFDIILFCHSMYGMKPKRGIIERALEMLAKRPEGAMVVVFHRDGTLHLDGLVCHRSACFPTGVTRLIDDDEVLDRFTPLISGFVMEDVDVDQTVRVEWRKVCRALGRREEARPNYLLFSSPIVMMAFTRDATTLPELMAQVPSATGDRIIKNREARLNHPAAIIKPTEVQHVQQCVRWASKHRVSLTIIGGGHSGHCLRDNVVSIDMRAFDQVHIVAPEDELGFKHSSLVVAGAGCSVGRIVRETMAMGFTVPLGSRPSVGTGLWLQGGIGHLARLHGLACDAVVGAIVVSVSSGEVLCIGRVPGQHRPVDAVRPENERDLLWAMKGAGTNIGIVISVTFKAQTAPTYLIRNWDVSLSDKLEAECRLRDFDKAVSRDLSKDCSVDAYLYWDADNLHLAVTMFESSTTGVTLETTSTMATTKLLSTILGPEVNCDVVDGVGLFDTEMYMSGMHDGHGGGKTSSFKRCLLLNCIGAAEVSSILIAALEARPSALCYLHLIQGGGAVADPIADATAFGCRDWDFACVITGAWSRGQDGPEVARDATQWVYNVATALLPMSNGAYSADLGPDPRDAALAAKAFGPNAPRLARLKHSVDPRNLLAYTCPLPNAPIKPKLIILVTGESCAGKDFCAGIWVSMFTTIRSLAARSVSISNATKRDYAVATGADLDRLLQERAYKERHRPALTEFFRDQVRRRPWLPEQRFLDVVSAAVDMDVLLITGMRDEAPVAVLSHLVSPSRLVEVQVRASAEVRLFRRGDLCRNGDSDISRTRRGDVNDRLNLGHLGYHPSLVFDNDTIGAERAKTFAEQHLLPFCHEDLQRLDSMVRPVPGFPHPGIEFRHVLDVSQRPGGLSLCTSLLQAHFAGDWSMVDAVACCEAGGFVFASALATRLDKPLVLIREAGKLPPPTISVIKAPSHISSSTSEEAGEKSIEMGRDVIPRGASVVVIDDVLATGTTLCAVLQLLNSAGIRVESVAGMVVAEFPVHRGRDLLRQHGFGKVRIQSLLVYAGA